MTVTVETRLEALDGAGTVLMVTEEDEAMVAVAMRQGVSVEALRSQLVKVAETFAADPSRCSFCEGPLSVSVLTHHGRYCDAGCRKDASRERRTEARS